MLIVRFTNEVQGQPLDIATVLARAKSTAPYRAITEVVEMLVVRRRGFREAAPTEKAARAGVSASRVSAAVHDLERRGAIRLEHVPWRR
jgi:hypothetical protein